MKSLLLIAGMVVGLSLTAAAEGIKDVGESKYELSVGELTMVVDAGHGGKVLSLNYKDTEVISQSRFPESFGSTFWTSPQKEWNWPPVPEYDKGAYAVEQNGNRLKLTSEVSGRLKFRIRKEFAINNSDKSFDVTYSIINEDDHERSVAPWEITRVPNEGLIFFDAKEEDITPVGLMPFKSAFGAVWCVPDVAQQNRKINADGKGWLAFYNNGLLLVKHFEDIDLSQPAPGESEIQVYINRGKTYIELESQGAYQKLQPGESLSWSVKWLLTPVEAGQEPSEALLQKVKEML